MDSESQDATKMKSALAGPSTYSSVKMITQDMHMNGMNIFLSISPFLPLLWQCRHQGFTGVCMASNSFLESAHEDYD